MRERERERERGTGKEALWRGDRRRWSGQGKPSYAAGYLYILPVPTLSYVYKLAKVAHVNRLPLLNLYSLLLSFSLSRLPCIFPRDGIKHVS